MYYHQQWLKMCCILSPGYVLFLLLMFFFFYTTNIYLGQNKTDTLCRQMEVAGLEKGQKG